MERLIDGVFADILRANRDGLNARFAAAQRLHPGLDPAAFSAVLCDLVAPLVTAVERTRPEAARPVALVLYDLALDLLSQGFLGPNSRHPFIAQGWRDLLPGLPQQISAAPRQVVGALTNALYNLAQVQGARPQEWLETMLTLAPLAPDPQLYLQGGQIAAWRAGLAHYRPGALELCRTLPAALVGAALRLPPGSDPHSTLELVNRLAADPWLHPDAAQRPSAPGLQIVARVGAFRGFGGLFLQTPKVYAAGEHFVVVEGDSRWLLVADCFGATLHRVDGVEVAGGPAPFVIDSDGRVGYAQFQHSFDELAGYTSAASNGLTLAVTSPLSFAVSLVAPVGV